MPAKLQRKPEGSYHHGDLEHALVDAAVQTIREEGVQALTLRGVGARLGVSRTALYRHFAHKTALLARVALEGFRLLHHALAESSESAANSGVDPLEAMGLAYVRFAMANPSHYQTMFGGYLENWDEYPDLARQGQATFGLLVQAIAHEQERSRAIAGDPVELAKVTWALVHGIATLGIAGHFDSAVNEVAALANRVLWDGLHRR